jgi:hypothetical protein
MVSQILMVQTQISFIIFFGGGLGQKGYNWLDFFYIIFLSFFNNFFFEGGCKDHYSMKKL